MAIVTDKTPFEYPKQPSEKELIAVDFSRRIPSAVTIVAVSGVPGTGYSVTVSLSESDSTQAGGYNPSNLVASGLSVNRKILSCMVSGGTDKNVYRCTFIVTLSDGQIKEEDVFVRVNEV
jgi:hypothetical protein